MKTILVDAVHCFVIAGKGIFQPMKDLLDTYPNKKIILTNADDDQMTKFGLHDVPYELFTLKHDPDKVDPVYYEKMLEHFGLQPDQVVYFEHDAAAVESAKSKGIQTFYYDSEKQDLFALKAFLDQHL